MVRWTLPAKNDLKAIFDFIEKDSRYYAEKVIENIVEKSKQIEQFPASGRVVPEIENENTRELFIYSYRLIYEIEDGIINMLAVIHGARDISEKDIKI